MDGVLVASDAKQEWLLPWWWDNYRLHNDFPVAFVDFGLSEEALQWCQERGELLSLPSSFDEASQKNADPKSSLFWESIYESRKWWDKRGAWHKKPLALLQSPYERTLWLDLDCEVQGHLASLFAKIGSHLLLCPELEEMQEFDRSVGHLLENEILYNSGVIGFQKQSPFIIEWALATEEEHAYHWSDQNLLSRLIHTKNWPIQELDRIYNWRPCSHGLNPQAVIVHWVGEPGKFFISLKMEKFL